MAAITEDARAGGFLMSEGNGDISRAVVTIASGAGDLLPGTVLGKITASGKYSPYLNTGTAGLETAAAILYAGVDATSADKTAVVIVRLAEVATARLAWANGLNGSDKTAAYTDLAASFVIAR
jgi:hypothetical protein